MLENNIDLHKDVLIRAMHGAIADGRTDLVFEYLALGNPVNSKDSGGVSLLQWCAYYGDVSAIRYLILNGESLDSLGDNFDLNGAVFHGHWQLCQYLIEQGADVNTPLPETEEAPLHSALCKANRPGYDLIVELLLHHGANPNSVTKSGVDTGSFMRDCTTKGETPLHRAAAFGSEKTIDLLLGAGARIDAKDSHGDTPLGWASWHLRPENILRKLCYGEFSIHPERNSDYDHGQGWGSLERYVKGKPNLT